MDRRPIHASLFAKQEQRFWHLMCVRVCPDSGLLRSCLDVERPTPNPQSCRILLQILFGTDNRRCSASASIPISDRSLIKIILRTYCPLKRAIAVCVVIRDIEQLIRHITKTTSTSLLLAALSANP